MAVSAIPVRDPVKDCYDHQCSCPSNKKELVLHNQHVSRLPRTELENRFLHVYEDNIRLKTDCNHLRDQLKRLSTRVFRLIESRKNIPYGGAGGFERQALSAEMLLSEQAQHIATLEAENEIWRAKVESMRQQFLSCRSFSSFKQKNAKKCSSVRHEQWFLEEEIERLKDHLKKMERTVNILRNGGEADDNSGNGGVKGKGKGKNRDTQSPISGDNNNKTDLEEERSRVQSDVELIKAKRLLMAQAQQLKVIRERAMTVEKELAEKQKGLQEKTQNCEEISEKLKKNANKIIDLQQEITELRQYQQKVKDLSEQIRELRLERDELKAHNTQLVHLSTAAVSSSRSTAAEETAHATGESLATLQQRVTILESALSVEKAERLTAEASKEKESLQIAQLRKQNDELVAREKDLVESLQTEKTATANFENIKKETENLRTLNSELQSKCQTLENKLKEKDVPCERCLQLEKELEVAKIDKGKPMEEIFNFANVEEESSVVDLLRKIQKFREQNSSPTAMDILYHGGNGPVRRYPTLEQTRSVLGLNKTKLQDDVDNTQIFEEGQGDHQRNSRKHSQVGIEGTYPCTSASSGSIFANVSQIDRIAAENEGYFHHINDSKPPTPKDESDSAIAQTPQTDNDAKFLETVRELEKCQKQLRVQENINKLYREEIDALAKEIMTRTGKYSSSPEI